MKLLLLFGLLLAGSVAQGQAWKSWAGKLPVDAESKLVVYQGRVAVPGTSAAALQQRAKKYMVAVAHMEKAYASGLRTFIGFGQEGRIKYQLVITSAKGRYSYSLFHLEYAAHAGEYFAEGKITPRYNFRPAEGILQHEKEQSDAGWQEWQTIISTAAKQVITQMQSAMKQ